MFFSLLLILPFIQAQSAQNNNLNSINCFSDSYNGVCIVSQNGYLENGFAGSTGLGSLNSKPTLSQSSFINLVNKLGTPISTENGFAVCAYNEGIRYGVNPIYMLGFANEETSLGSAGIGLPNGNKNLFGLTLGTAGDPNINSDVNKVSRFKSYSTYCDSVTDWDAYIYNYYFSKGDYTLNQIVPIYAPSSDNNNVPEYIANVQSFVNKYN